MPEPVSTIGCLVGYAALYATVQGRSAVSPEAQVVRASAIEVVVSAEASFALFGNKALALSQLRTLANECAESNWDGNGSEPLHPVALLIAENFLRAFPSNLPLPEFSTEPDGSVSLDWIESRTRIFSLSIGSRNRLAYAWLDGSDRGHGVAGFDGAHVPARVLEGIRAILNYGNAPVRSV